MWPQGMTVAEAPHRGRIALANGLRHAGLSSLASQPGLNVELVGSAPTSLGPPRAALTEVETISAPVRLGLPTDRGAAPYLTERCQRLSVTIAK